MLRARELNISRGFRGKVEVFCEPIPARAVKEHITATFETGYFQKMRF
jgi:hypothetical protein